GLSPGPLVTAAVVAAGYLGFAAQLGPAALGSFELLVVAAVGLGGPIAPPTALAFALVYHAALVLPVALVPVVRVAGRPLRHPPGLLVTAAVVAAGYLRFAAQLGPAALGSFELLVVAAVGLGGPIAPPTALAFALVYHAALVVPVALVAVVVVAGRLIRRRPA